MKVLPSVKARTSDMFVRVRNAVLTRHVERDARPSVRADTRAFRSMALTGPIAEGPRFGVPIPSPAGVSSEVSVQERKCSRRCGHPHGNPRYQGHRGIAKSLKRRWYSKKPCNPPAQGATAPKGHETNPTLAFEKIGRKNIKEKARFRAFFEVPRDSHG